MLRIIPWITDDATRFLLGYLASRPADRSLRCFEFGCGNSTLFFLSLGLHVTSVDHDSRWSQTVTSTAEAWGYSDRLILLHKPRPYSDIYSDASFDIISIDGRDRVKCLERVLAVGHARHALLVLDNTERATLGGAYVKYMSLLRDYSLIHFEQPRISGAPPGFATYYDRAGQRVPHRWVTTIACYSSIPPRTTSGFLL